MSKKFKVQFIVMVGIPEKRIFFWIAITKKKQNNSSYVRPCLSSIKKSPYDKKGDDTGAILAMEAKEFQDQSSSQSKYALHIKSFNFKRPKFPNLAFDSVMCIPPEEVAID